jgi:serine/threonine protein kinase
MSHVFRVHRYLIGDVIAKGEFASIRVCYRNGVRDPLCARLIPRNPRHGNPDLFKERILSPLFVHPNIISVIDVFDTATCLIQIMPFHPLGNAVSYLVSNRLRRNELLQIADDILAGVEYLHSLHICHRDIKLDNVLINDSRRAKLGDFGMATITFDGKVTGTCGSIHYIAPEAVGGEPYDGFAADIWSLGVLIYVLFVRGFPYPHQPDRWAFESAEPTFSIIPVSIRTLVISMLSTEPLLRPDIHTIRSDPCFVQLRSAPLPPFGKMDLDAPIPDICQPYFSRVCQIHGLGTIECHERLVQKKPTVEKLIYRLLKIQIRSEKTPGFGNSWSGPSLASSRSFQRVICHAKSCEVLACVESFFMEKNGCVSAPSARKRTIIVNGATDDVKLKFDCVDAPEPKKCEFTIGESPLARELIRSLSSQFDTETSV